MSRYDWTWVDAGSKTQLGFALASSTVIMRLDGHLMHAIANGALVGNWPCFPRTDSPAAGLRSAARRTRQDVGSKDSDWLYREVSTSSIGRPTG